MPAACTRLKLNRTRCQRWESEEWFEVVCEEERKDWLVGAGIDQKQEILVPLVPDTIRAVRDSLHSEDEKIRLQAAQFVLDNIFGQDKKPVGRPRKDSDGEVQMPDLSDIMSRAADKISAARNRSEDRSATSIVSSEQVTQDFEDQLALRIKMGNLPNGVFNGNT